MAGDTLNAWQLRVVLLASSHEVDKVYKKGLQSRSATARSLLVTKGS
jgi:hypothetical protein